ncbi:MAG: LPS assembly protein LptD [Rhodospirillum sp.]|nr:LPS assembly protein LptD [Rhodospirillum sp.]MCF8488643.1 LPS assembly protein LptD [Rhodospirillum sp.]MCF8503026.1 LPS assembly protein LptD [Rhodospirillum sp.]
MPTYTPLTQASPTTTLASLQSLGSNPARAEPGAITLQPINTNDLSQLNSLGPTAPKGTAPVRDPGLAAPPSSGGPPTRAPVHDDTLTQAPESRTLVSANEMTQDDDLGIVTARGDVTVVSGEQTLRADVVTYNTVQNLVTASGNVSLTATGTVEDDTTFAQYMELTGDLKNGFIRGVQMLMANGGRMAALYGERDDTSQRKEFSKGVYTACNSCSGSESPLPTMTGRREGPRQPPPVWQLKAARITHDEQAQDIIYNDAWLELFGVPVLYTPYLSQPDPTVYRRSGLMNISPGSSSLLGATLYAPYYIVWDDHADSTVAVQYSELQNVLLHGTYDRNFKMGEFAFRGSMAPYDQDGYFQFDQESSGAYNFDKTWRAGFESAYTSDPIYLYRAGLEPQNDAAFLTNNLYLRGSQGRSALSTEAIYFQDVNEPLIQDSTPYVPVMIDYNLVTDPLWWNGHAEADFNGTVLRRGEGTNMNRLVGRMGYQQPIQDGLGSEWMFNASLRGDFYNSEDVTLDNGSSFTGNQARFVPQASAIWRYPLVNATGTSRHVIEPKVGFFTAMPNNNPDEIPNEDSQAFNLDISNLFNPSRLPGYDRVEGGQWASYSMRYAYYDESNQNLEVEVGQTYRLQRDTSLFGQGSGMENNMSDIVGRLRYNYGSYFTASYGTQLDADTFEPTRHELTASTGTSLLSGSLTYLYAKQTATTTGDSIAERNQISGSLGTRFARYWSATGSHTYSINLNEPVSTSLTLNYEDECIRVQTLFTRDHTEKFGEEAGTSFLVNLSLKTLGSYSFSPGLFSSSSNSN